MSTELDHPASEGPHGNALEVPPDKNPAGRVHGDLLGTLALLQETYAELWLFADVLRDDKAASRRNQQIGQLIATAVEQCKKLPSAGVGDLAQWREEVSAFLESALRFCGNRNKLNGEELNTLVFYIDMRLKDAKAHLAAMPAPPGVNTKLLKALKGLRLAISEGNTYQPDRSDGAHREPASSLISLKAQDDATAAIAQAEGAAK